MELFCIGNVVNLVFLHFEISSDTLSVCRRDFVTSYKTPPPNIVLIPYASRLTLSCIHDMKGIVMPSCSVRVCVLGFFKFLLNIVDLQSCVSGV